MTTKAKKASARQDSNKGSVRLLPEVHKRLKLYAVREGRDMRDLATEVLDDYLRKRGA